jgi:hypothetical protein
MNPSGLARNYGHMTPEERWRLMLAAEARSDDAERDRLANAAERITLSALDVVPHTEAFDLLALLVFIGLLEEAGRQDDAWARVHDARDPFGDDEAEEEEGDEVEDETGARAGEGSANDAGRNRPAWKRLRDIALSSGFVLRTKADGWKLFCDRLGIPPFVRWEGLPGLDRLRRALVLAEKVALTPEEMLRWLNRKRSDGKPEVQELRLTPEACAAGCEMMFRKRLEWAGG